MDGDKSCTPARPPRRVAGATLSLYFSRQIIKRWLKDQMNPVNET
jgi:hypothetical protein